MKISVLVAEIGSTTTVVNAFSQLDTQDPIFLGQGQAATTVHAGDVRIGMTNAIEDLKRKLNVTQLTYDRLFATSSAAGGLKMSVHGLVYDMTVSAASAAALGAGANLNYVTAGKIRRSDIAKIIELKPNMILIAGGVDYGEYETALYNAELIVKMPLDVPVIYAGNIANQEDIKLIFEEAGKSHLLYLVENVYPKLDTLNVEPTRALIHDAFEAHIMQAPGMEHIFDMVTDHIMPTPGAVMQMTKLLKSHIDDVLTIDVGGATTDIHSVTEGSEMNNRILIAPEPVAKRTVEGDLGLYVSRKLVADLMGIDKLAQRVSMSQDELLLLLENLPAIPTDPQHFTLAKELCFESVKIALQRHAGSYRDIFSTTGRQTIAQGKDLSAVKNIVLTGGALVHLDEDRTMISRVLKVCSKDKMLPFDATCMLVDHDYIMASLGVLSLEYPEQALRLIEKSFRKQILNEVIE